MYLHNFDFELLDFLCVQWKSVERLGATVVLVGDSYDEAQAYAKQRGEEECRTFIPPFDHPDVIMGQGTIGMEIVRQMQGPLDAIFVPVGGGGLIAGIAAYVKRGSPEVCAFPCKNYVNFKIYLAYIFLNYPDYVLSCWENRILLRFQLDNVHD